MDATAFRWVLVVIAILVAIGIYLYGQHQARMRKRSAIETFTREEVESEFVEDEQLRCELNNLNQILKDSEVEESLGEIQINPASEIQKAPYTLPDPEIYVPAMLTAREQVVSHHLRHDDFRLITGDEVGDAVLHAELELNAEGLLELREEEEVTFQIASLSAPGHFSDLEKLDFSTLGFNCFIDLDLCENPRLAYETMLKKIDELVRMLDVKVYKPSQELLTINDISSIREQLA